MAGSSSSDSTYDALYHHMVKTGIRPVQSPQLVGAQKTAWKLAERCWGIRKTDGEEVRRPSMSFILKILQKVETGAYEDAEAELVVWDTTPSSVWDVQDISVPEPAESETS